MLLSTGLALIAAISALVTLVSGARKDNRGLLKHEWLIVFFTVTTFLATAYQFWKIDYQDKVRNLLSIDWERELDAPITDVRISFLYPNGSTLESEVARLAGALRFEFQGTSGTTTFRLAHGSDDIWRFSSNSKAPKPVLGTVYGTRFKANDSWFCWWSDSWGDPGQVYVNDNQGKKWKDRSLCSLQLRLPLTDFPLKQLRFLGDIKQLTVFLDKDPGKTMCDGDCYNPAISILIATEGNRFDISPLRDMNPSRRGESVAWSSTGDGIRERTHLLFTQREGMSSRESMKERMDPVDKLTEQRTTLVLYPPFYILPDIPREFSESETFTGKFGQNKEIMRIERWCGLADFPKLCVQQAVAAGPSAPMQ